MTNKGNRDRIKEMLEQGMTQKAIAEELGISPPRVNQIVKDMNKKAKPLSVQALTQKKQVFAEAKADGFSNTAAAQKAFDCTTLASAKSLGCAMAKDPDIKVAIGDLMAQEGLTRRSRINKMAEIMESEDLGAVTRVLDMSWKLDGSYAPQVVEIVDGSEHIRQLTETMKRLYDQFKDDIEKGIEDGSIIDVTAESDAIADRQEEVKEDINKNVPLVKAPDMEAITAEYQRSLENSPPADFIPPWQMETIKPKGTH